MYRRFVIVRSAESNCRVPMTATREALLPPDVEKEFANYFLRSAFLLIVTAKSAARANIPPYR